MITTMRWRLSDEEKAKGVEDEIDEVRKPEVKRGEAR